ncbi:17314_t:CDS:1, partial [Funneliformis geosporum]
IEDRMLIAAGISTDIDPIFTVIIHGIIDHVPAIIQEIEDPIPEDTEEGHILHEGEVFR